ncbi:MAG: rRNA maturation RNase YbeY [Puniceicoccales bacterium]|jgi:probable rRNA maturation factor|nr:rRNA maturation RNase YbeY [Puniceicoccales bacterium]
MNREISIFNGVGSLIFSKHEVISLFKALDSSKYSIQDGDLSIAFLTTGNMVAIHGKFMGDDTGTDVITFPGDSNMGFAGEICVSPDYAIGSHLEHGTTFSEELTLYLIHGYLHLFGLDDVSEADTVWMRDGEKFCMELVKNKNCMPKFFYDNLCSCKE